MSFKLVLFGYDLKKSITPYIPNKDSLLGLAKKYENRNLSIIVFDPYSDQVSSEKITYIKDYVYNWEDHFSKEEKPKSETNSSKENKIQEQFGFGVLNDYSSKDQTNAIDLLKEEVVFVAISEKQKDTYSIMEELETQRYDKRYYYSYGFNKVKRGIESLPILLLEDYIEDVIENLPNLLLEEESKSPKRLGDKPPTKSRLYQLYSGDKFPDDDPQIDYQAICWRMLLICENIKLYLKMGFAKQYNIKEMRTLPSPETGYNEKPFYSQAEIDLMTSNSHLFQAEDPILKGFILAHPIKVVAKQKSEFNEENKEIPISPLDIGRTVQWLIFNHGQFRKELLICLMRVVVAFAANNGLLEAKDIPKSTVKPKQVVKKERRKTDVPVVTTQTSRRVIVSGGANRTVQQHIGEEEEEEEEESNFDVEDIYFKDDVWDVVIRELKKELNIS